MPSVMIVDDLPAVHEMLEAVINPAGYSSECFVNGRNALKRYKEQRFDIVLADLSMKPMDGVSLLREIIAYDPQAKVIMITGYSTTDSARQALKLGAFDYVEKPFRIDDLIDTLNRAISANGKTEPADPS
jgi:two-component system response regulator HydG